LKMWVVSESVANVDITTQSWNLIVSQLAEVAW